MTIDFEPRKLDTFLKTEEEMAKIIDKYKDGPLPGHGFMDAEDYACLQVVFCYESRDYNELLEWTPALTQSVLSEGESTDLLREKLEKEAKAFIDGAEGDPESIKHGKALLNLANSIINPRSLIIRRN